MQLKNYQEDIVLNLINIVLKDYPDIKADEDFIHDVAAYSLNRIPPRYIMSERGFTRFASMQLFNDDDENNKDTLVEMMMIVNIAVEYLNTRRKTDRESSKKKDVDKNKGKILYDKFIHNFPQLIGKVIDKSNNKPIIDSCITLYIDGKKAESAETNWPNPYCTNNATNGFYSFWPKSVIDPLEKKEFKIELKVEHKGYIASNITKVIKTQGAFHQSDLIDGETLVKIPTCSLIKK